MRKLYEINKSIEDLLETVTDPETGEVVDLDALDDLLVEREQKIESVILYRKDVLAEAAAIYTEITELTKRHERLMNTSEGLDGYIAKAINGQNFKTARCEVTHRMTEVADVDEDFVEWAKGNEEMSQFLKHSVKESYSADKVAIKKFLKAGGSLDHCRLVKHDNLQIK